MQRINNKENICIQVEKLIRELRFSVQYFCKSETFQAINDFFPITRFTTENPIITGMLIKGEHALLFNVSFIEHKSLWK